MIIDAWGQHPTARFGEEEIFASLRRWTRDETFGHAVPMATTIEEMDRGGVDKMLISAWVAPRNVMISNDEVAGFVGQAPARLVGVGSVDISKPMAAVREVRRCVRELGFKAIRVLPWLWEVPPTDRRFYPVYVACIEEGVPFCTQVGHTGPLMPSEVGRPIYLDQVALDFPELVIVGGHIGYPWTDEVIAVATKHRNVYIDTSAYTVRRYPPHGRVHAHERCGQGAVRHQLSDDHRRQGVGRPRRPRVVRRSKGAVPVRRRSAGVRSVGAGLAFGLGCISMTVKLNSEPRSENVHDQSR